MTVAPSHPAAWPVAALLGLFLSAPGQVPAQSAAPSVEGVAPQSCTAVLESIRNRLQPLAAEAGERTLACELRDTYVRQISELGRELGAAQAELGAQRAQLADARTALGALRVERDNALRQAQAEVARARAVADEAGRGRDAVARDFDELLQPVSAALHSALNQALRRDCDALEQPDFQNGAFELRGRVTDPRRLRQAVEEQQRRFGVPIRIEDVRAESCKIRLARGWIAEPTPEGSSIRQFRSAELPRGTQTEVPTIEMCREVTQALAEARRGEALPEVIAFWVWGRRGTDRREDWYVCRFGEVVAQNGAERLGLVTRGAP